MRHNSFNMALSSTTNQEINQMTTMKLELPTNEPSVLFHMSNALRSIAIDAGYTAQAELNQRVTVTETVGEVSRTVTTEPVVNDTEQYAKACSEHYGDTDMKMSGLMNHSKSSLEDILDNPPAATDELKELLSPHTEVVEYEPATTVTDVNGTEYQQTTGVVAPVNIVGTLSNDTIDADGLPWDDRIHSRGKTRLADDTWRLARKPADKSDDEWSTYVEEVKVELRELMSVPVATGEALDTIEEYLDGVNEQERVEDEKREALTPPTLDKLAVADLEQSTVELAVGDITLPPVSEMPLADVNPFEANPIVNSVVPPVATPPVASDAPTTFPLLMKWLTTNNKKLTSDMVNKVLTDNGVAALPLLFSREDLIPQIHAELVKLL